MTFPQGVDRRLRVLHVGKFYPPSRGGMEKVLQVLCEGERHLVDSQVLVASEQARTVHETVNEVPVTRVASLRKVGAVALCPTFPYWMRKLDGDVMVVHEPNPVAIVAHALARPASPLVFWVHAEVVRPAWRYRAFYRPFLVRMLERASRIVCRVATGGGAGRRTPAFPRQVRRHPVCARTRIEHAVTAPVASRVAAIKAESAAPLVLFVGRLVPYKGVDVLLRAMKDVEARAVIVGDGPLRGELEAMARELGISDRVRFAGNASQEELTALYNACDVFVLPSVTRARRSAWCSSKRCPAESRSSAPTCRPASRG